MRDALDRTRSTIGRAARTVLSPAGIRGAGVEIAWTTAHFALYPLGLLREKVRDPVDHYTLRSVGPWQRGLVIGDVAAAGTPIVLIHGFVDNRTIFALLRRTLRRRGFGRVTTMSYSIFTPDIRAAAERFGAEVERVCTETGYERIHVVGHSLGGLIARYYVQRLGGDARVHTLATLGTAHQGTYLAHLMNSRLVRQLRPGSALLTELAGPAPGCQTRFVCFWSDLDQLVVPQRHAQLEHPDLSVRNVFCRGVGHMSLPIDGRIVHEIATTFAHLDEDGSTSTAGVTPIADATSTAARSTRAPTRRRVGPAGARA